MTGGPCNCKGLRLLKRSQKEEAPREFVGRLYDVEHVDV